jgi:hypothetical protein
MSSLIRVPNDRRQPLGNGRSLHLPLSIVVGRNRVCGALLPDYLISGLLKGW